MSRTIDNPIINSPFREPSRHFAFDELGITPEIVEGRRQSEYFIPIARSKQKGAQLAMDTYWTAERAQSNEFINKVRARVSKWRQDQYPGVTPMTRRLLDHWNDPRRENKLFFCQIEALETAIYIAEVATKSSDAWIETELRQKNEAFNAWSEDPSVVLPRLALKMATGSGKTVVMAMLIAWQALNKLVSLQNKLFSDTFLVVTPGVTIRDRLQVLQPNHPENYYEARDLLPGDLFQLLQRANVLIVNFHGFLQRETLEAPKLNKMILSGGDPDAFKETPAQVIRRVCRAIANKKNIVVLNDEAHHCYQGKPISEEEEALKGEERREAEKQAKAAAVWFRGLAWLHRKIGLRAVYDLSATPFFLRGSGYAEGDLFPWVASDFSLIDAIESGIVKVPRVPVSDDAGEAEAPIYRHLWPHIKDELPKKNRSELTKGGEPKMPAKLETAIQQLYGNYEKSFNAWKKDKEARARGLTPPVFIVVCNNTSVSKMVYDHITGWEKVLKSGSRLVPGACPLFSNVDQDGRWLKNPYSILVDSEQLESGEALSGDFKKLASREIDEFKDEYRRRYPGRDVENITDADLLREVMNTVGKPGKLGEAIRCVVSVSMLTEGWDENTVTHILGIRAFGTQLLCEQVIGRGLRRRSYAPNAEGFFEPEYAEVYGVPFSFIPTAGHSDKVNLGRIPTRVKALPDRHALEIQFPLLDGYRQELNLRALEAQFDNGSNMVLPKDGQATMSEVAPIVGEGQLHSLEDLEALRPAAVDFRVAKTLVHEYLKEDDQGIEPWLFPQALRLVRQWREEHLRLKDNGYVGLLAIKEYQREAAEKIYRALKDPTWRVGEAKVLPHLRPYQHWGSTRNVGFDTLKDTWTTRPDKSPVSHVVADSAWEIHLAQILESMEEVLSYVKNQGLGFVIPYEHLGQSHQYFPDFIAKIDDGAGLEDPLNLIIEVSGERRSEKDAKTDTVRKLWLPAVNGSGAFGRWAFIEITDPGFAKSAIREQFGEFVGPEGPYHRLLRKTPGVCGGDACIRRTRIPVWSLVGYRALGQGPEQLLKSYPGLSAQDLEAAWAYERAHPDEIARCLQANEAAV